MTPEAMYVTLALSGLASVGTVTAATLAGWRGWLQLKAHELEQVQTGNAPVPSAGSRIEIADLKERIRKLEAIAAGVDL
ncbi:MAG TPA: hypothetical protein VF695_01950 [Sphingomonas sp.]|jgi:hypothetical protein